ncbi:protealysin inhibitor emfourin [Nocardioides sp. 1609]|uniref:protealysin inhibitor emfourin n=1 Tax=Nocardioides sp. 1609 TaxID=2508327 RepID=UPI00106F4A29|nr:protealysin inhibitor emfourin [Nocardioides sp. 1609]
MSRTHCFLPPYLLTTLARTRPEVAARWAQTLAEDRRFRAVRDVGEASGAAAATGPAWVVHTAGGGTTLPGDVVRSAGEPEAGDLAVDEAATGIAGSLALFEEVYGRRSYDDRGATVSLSVHYGTDYVNAFWDGTQLVFGDGDGEVFDRFTKPVDVLAHELTHAVTEHTAGLVYQGQSGALNESVSDVFAACLKQRLLGQSPAEADWLIGAGLFLPGVDARGLRDMAAPGTAYDDPALGRDPQPAHLRDYVETADDNGGVHLNSGIPNRAFQLAAVALGGSSWERAGRVWYAALTGGDVGPRVDFAGFAAATIAAAERVDGVRPGPVAQAWAEVGVSPDGAGAPSPAPAPPLGGGRVAVRRSGGFAGRTTTGEVDLTGDDERAGELRDLVGRIDVHGVGSSAPQPDRFVYSFELGDAQVTVPEQDLTSDLRRVADLVLGDGDPDR